MRILFVDDNSDLRILLPLLLEKRGHSVRAAATAAEALACATEFRPDVVLSDISMPEMDGYDLVARLRAQLPEPFMAVALTGFDAPLHEEEARHAVFDEYLTKPINFERLYVALDRIGPEPEASPANSNTNSAAQRS